MHVRIVGRGIVGVLITPCRKERAMPRIDPPSRSASLPSWWKPASIIAVGGLLAFTIWTVPYWGEFWSHVSQFPSLWQIPTNHRIIISLLIKVASPLLIMGIIGMIVWIYYLMNPSQDDGVTDTPSREHVLYGALTEQRIYRGTASSLPEQNHRNRMDHCQRNHSRSQEQCRGVMILSLLCLSRCHCQRR